MIFLFLALLTVSLCRPNALREHDFLSSFTKSQFIQTVAILVTVSLVNVLQIHLEYTRIERRFKKRVFVDCRRSVNLSATILIAALAFSIFLSVAYEFAYTTPFWSSIFHGLTILTIFQCLFIMYDLVQTATTLAEDEPLENPKEDAATNPVSPPPTSADSSST